MIKETIVNPTLTPGARLSFAESMLLGRPAEAQTRWSPGSLATSVIGAATMPLIVFISLTQLVAVSGANAALNESIATILNPASLQFKPEIGDGKTREVTIDGYSYNADVVEPVEGLTIDPESLAGRILKPVRPTYTALSLVNALETLAPSGDFYLIALNQVTGEVVYSTFESQASVDTAIAAAVATAGVSVEAAYLMTPPTSGGGSSTFGKYGWE